MSLPVLAGIAQRITPMGVTLLSLFSVAACTKTLPPAPTPERLAPVVDSSAPLAAGQGRLVIDVVEGPTPVQRVHMAPEQIDDGQGGVRFRFVESPELLCASPCVVDLPIGNVLLGFPVLGDEGATEIELVHISAEASVYRRSLSQYHGSTGGTLVYGIVGTALGAAAATTGVTLLPIGLSKGNDGLTIAGGVSLGVGAVLVALGIWAIRSDSRTYRPGSSLHF